MFIALKNFFTKWVSFEVALVRFSYFAIVYTTDAKQPALFAGYFRPTTTTSTRARER